MLCSCHSLCHMMQVDMYNAHINCQHVQPVQQQLLRSIMQH